MLESSVHSAAAWSQICATRTTDSEMGGVKVHIVMPASPLPANANKVLINFHAGGFTADSGSLTESIPIA